MKPRIAVEIAMAQEGEMSAAVGGGQIGQDVNAGMVPISAMLGSQGGVANALNDFAVNEPMAMD